MFLRPSELDGSPDDGPSSRPSASTPSRPGTSGSYGGYTPGGRPGSARTPVGSVGRHYGYGAQSPMGSPMGGGYSGASRPMTHSGAYGARGGDDGGDSRPATTGGLGLAGALPSTEGRKSMLDRQRELAKKRRQMRMGGGFMATRAVDGPEGPRSPSANPQRTPSIRQFSAPRLVKSSSGGKDDDEPEPEAAARSSTTAYRSPSSTAGGTGSSLADVIREREKARAASRSTSGPMSPVARHMAARGVESTFDPDPKGRERTTIGSPEKIIGIEAMDMSDMKKFLTTPAPRAAGIVQCYIHRHKSGLNKLYPVYHLFMKEHDKFLLAAKKRAKQKTSNYLVSMSKDDLSRTSENFVGKLRSNFVGTEFYIYDNGPNPKEVDPAAVKSGTMSVREELGLITYASNVLGSKGPRKMKVCLPRVHGDKRVVFQPTGKESEIMAKYKSNDLDDIQFLINKPPRWNEQVGAYVLNFNGRVTMASVKNFQLVDPDDQEPVLLQFGRVGKDMFTMDYQWPLSPLQAFCVCLSSFDYKIACE